MKKKRISKKDLFLELAQPDQDGISRVVYVSEFIDKYEKLVMGNGGDWCRTDGSLSKDYIVRRNKEKGRIISVQLSGFNKKNKIDKQIRKDIVDNIKQQRCCVLNISNVEVDHKDGRRDDYHNFKIENQKVDQFQPLSPAVNKAKREHCKKCRKTNKRFDARVLGFKRGQWASNGVYEGTCLGCYWHDIRKFNEEISKS